MTAETTPQAAPINEARIVAFARDVLALPLFERQATIVSEIYRDGIRTAVLRLGRRAGKDRIASVVATFEATVGAAAHLAAVPAGEQVEIVVVATSQKQARICMRYVAGYFRRPMLAPLVERTADDELTLKSGIVVRTLPCTAAAARGSGVAVVILTEAAHFNGRDGSPLDVGEIWSALTPATAQFPERRIIVASTPKWSSDWFARLCQRAERGDDPTMRTWHESTSAMNPTIDPAFLAAEQAADPENFRREYLAEFLSGVGAALDPDLVRSAATGEERPPVEGMTYVLAIDPAFASGGDRFAAIVGHREEDRTVVDRLASWSGSRGSPVRLDQTLDELAELSATYFGARIVSDQYAAEPVKQGLEARGLVATTTPWTNESKSAALTLLRRGLYQNRLVLPRRADLVNELCNLEIRQTPGGRPRIAAAGSGHDDWCSCLFGLLQAIELPARPGIIGVWERLAQGPLPEPKPTEAAKLPEVPRDRCPVSVRVDNAPTRCALSFGHRGDHVPGEPVPV